MIYQNQPKVSIFVSLQIIQAHFVSDKSLETFESKANTKLIKISDWLIANKLSLNTKKSNFLTIPAKKRHHIEIWILSLMAKN